MDASTLLALAGAALLTGAAACGGGGHTPTAPDAHPQSNAALVSLDRALDQRWTSRGVEVSAPIDGAAFLRRASLDLVGRVPTAREVERARDLEGPAGRAEIVDALLASEEHAAYWATIYADLVVGDDPRVRSLAYEPVRAELEEALRRDRPFDAVLRDLLTARGEVADEPSAAYVVARLRNDDASVLVDGVARDFAGVRIACAQCHDHPYADYTQEDYLGFTAFFARTRLSVDRQQMPPRVEVVERRAGERRAPVPGSESPRARTWEPTYFGRTLELEAGADRRARLFDELQRSGLLAKTTAGRAWSRLFGRGIEEPFDDLGGPNEAHDPLLEVLAEGFEANGWSHRELLRTIATSEAYARSAGGGAEGREAAQDAFARARVRAVDADQLFTSLVTAGGFEEIEARRLRRRLLQNEIKARREYAFVFDDDEGASADAFAGNVPQSLLLLNGRLTDHASRRHAGGTLDRVLVDHAELEARAHALHRAVFARDARPEEIAQLESFVGQHGDEDATWEDVLFSMLVSSEFTTNH